MRCSTFAQMLFNFITNFLIWRNPAKSSLNMFMSGKLVHTCVEILWNFICSEAIDSVNTCVSQQVVWFKNYYLTFYVNLICSHQKEVLVNLWKFFMDEKIEKVECKCEILQRMYLNWTKTWIKLTKLTVSFFYSIFFYFVNRTAPLRAI